MGVQDEKKKESLTGRGDVRTFEVVPPSPQTKQVVMSPRSRISHGLHITGEVV